MATYWDPVKGMWANTGEMSGGAIRYDEVGGEPGRWVRGPGNQIMPYNAPPGWSTDQPQSALERLLGASSAATGGSLDILASLQPTTPQQAQTQPQSNMGYQPIRYGSQQVARRDEGGGVESMDPSVNPASTGGGSYAPYSRFSDAARGIAGAASSLPYVGGLAALAGAGMTANNVAVSDRTRQMAHSGFLPTSTMQAIGAQVPEWMGGNQFGGEDWLDAFTENELLALGGGDRDRGIEAAYNLVGDPQGTGRASNAPPAAQPWQNPDLVALAQPALNEYGRVPENFSQLAASFGYGDDGGGMGSGPGGTGTGGMSGSGGAGGGFDDWGDLGYI